MCHELLRSPNFFELLDRIDAERAEEVRAVGCSCGGVLHSARYPRKPRGIQRGLREGGSTRHSFCCDRCRRRHTRGTLVSNGTSSGPVVIDTTLLAAKGSIWLTRPAMIHYATPRAKMLEMADELFGHVLAGRIRAEPRQIFALEHAADAHRALEYRQTTESTVLLP